MSRAKGSRLKQSEYTAQAVRAAAPGLTGRQLEYWIFKGFIEADGPAVQGHPRQFSENELAVIGVLHRLTRAGIPAALASDLARRAVTAHGSRDLPSGSPVHVRLADGLYLTIYV